jgi:hypothetical protein
VDFIGAAFQLGTIGRQFEMALRYRYAAVHFNDIANPLGVGRIGAHRHLLRRFVGILPIEWRLDVNAVAH